MVDGRLKKCYNTINNQKPPELGDVEDVMEWMGVLGVLFLMGLTAMLACSATKEGGADRTVLRAVGAMLVYITCVPLLWNVVVHDVDDVAMGLRLIIPIFPAAGYWLLVGQMRRWVLAR